MTRYPYFHHVNTQVVSSLIYVGKQPPAEFCKIAVLRDGLLWFLCVALELQGDGTATFYRHTSWTNSAREAGIWPNRAALATLAAVRNTQPLAMLLPATFGEWVEQPERPLELCAP